MRYLCTELDGCEAYASFQAVAMPSVSEDATGARFAGLGSLASVLASFAASEPHLADFLSELQEAGGGAQDAGIGSVPRRVEDGLQWRQPLHAPSPMPLASCPMAHPIALLQPPVKSMQPLGVGRAEVAEPLSVQAGSELPLYGSMVPETLLDGPQIYGTAVDATPRAVRHSLRTVAPGPDGTGGLPPEMACVAETPQPNNLQACGELGNRGVAETPGPLPLPSDIAAQHQGLTSRDPADPPHQIVSLLEQVSGPPVSLSLTRALCLEAAQPELLSAGAAQPQGQAPATLQPDEGIQGHPQGPQPTDPAAEREAVQQVIPAGQQAGATAGAGDGFTFCVPHVQERPLAQATGPAARYLYQGGGFVTAAAHNLSHQDHITSASPVVAAPGASRYEHAAQQGHSGGFNTAGSHGMMGQGRRNAGMQSLNGLPADSHILQQPALGLVQPASKASSTLDAAAGDAEAAEMRGRQESNQGPGGPSFTDFPPPDAPPPGVFMFASGKKLDMDSISKKPAVHWLWADDDDESTAKPKPPPARITAFKAPSRTPGGLLSSGRAFSAASAAGKMLPGGNTATLQPSKLGPGGKPQRPAGSFKPVRPAGGFKAPGMALSAARSVAVGSSISAGPVAGHHSTPAIGQLPGGSTPHAGSMQLMSKPFLPLENGAVTWSAPSTAIPPVPQWQAWAQASRPPHVQQQAPTTNYFNRNQPQQPLHQQLSSFNQQPQQRQQQPQQQHLPIEQHGQGVPGYVPHGYHNQHMQGMQCAPALQQPSYTPMGPAHGHQMYGPSGPLPFLQHQQHPSAHFGTATGTGMPPPPPPPPPASCVQPPWQQPPLQPVHQPHMQHQQYQGRLAPTPYLPNQPQPFQQHHVNQAPHPQQYQQQAPPYLTPGPQFQHGADTVARGLECPPGTLHSSHPGPAQASMAASAPAPPARQPVRLSAFSTCSSQMDADMEAALAMADQHAEHSATQRRTLHPQQVLPTPGTAAPGAAAGMLPPQHDPPRNPVVHAAGPCAAQAAQPAPPVVVAVHAGGRCGGTQVSAASSACLSDSMEAALAEIDAQQAAKRQQERAMPVVGSTPLQGLCDAQQRPDPADPAREQPLQVAHGESAAGEATAPQPQQHNPDGAAAAIEPAVHMPNAAAPAADSTHEPAAAAMRFPETVELYIPETLLDHELAPPFPQSDPHSHKSDSHGDCGVNGHTEPAPAPVDAPGLAAAPVSVSEPAQPREFSAPVQPDAAPQGILIDPHDNNKGDAQGVAAAPQLKLSLAQVHLQQQQDPSSMQQAEAADAPAPSAAASAAGRPFPGLMTGSGKLMKAPSAAALARMAALMGGELKECNEVQKGPAHGASGSISPPGAADKATPGAAGKAAPPPAPAPVDVPSAPGSSLAKFGGLTRGGGSSLSVNQEILRAMQAKLDGCEVAGGGLARWRDGIATEPQTPAAGATRQGLGLPPLTGGTSTGNTPATVLRATPASSTAERMMSTGFKKPRMSTTTTPGTDGGSLITRRRMSTFVSPVLPNACKPLEHITNTSGGKRPRSDAKSDTTDSLPGKRHAPCPTSTSPGRAGRAGVPLQDYFLSDPQLHARALAAAPPAHIAQVSSITPQTAGALTFGVMRAGDARLGAPAVVQWGVGEAYEELLALGLSSHHVTKEWVANHFKWVVWKLASYERRFAATCGGRALTREMVLLQLRGRYEEEYSQGQRSVLRAVYQQDGTPRRPMILMVSHIYCPTAPGAPAQDPAAAPAHHRELDGPMLELSDGWYGIMARLDFPLEQAVAAGRIKVGTKLRVCGASLDGLHVGVDPLDTQAAAAALQLSYNGTSPARWDARLGTVWPPMCLRPLGEVDVKGGTVPHTIVVIQAKYPLHYFERMASGAAFRSQRAHKARVGEWEQWVEQAGVVAEASVLAAERAHCQRIQAAQAQAQAGLHTAEAAVGEDDEPPEGPSQAELVYAHMVLFEGLLDLMWDSPGGGGADRGSEGGLDAAVRHTKLPAAERQELGRLISVRRGVLAALRQSERLKALAHLSGGALDGGAGRGAGGEAAAGKRDKDTWPPECGVPVRRLRVSGVVHTRSAPAGEYVQALVSWWRPPEELEGSMKEGEVYLVSHLEPRPRARARGGETGSGQVLELTVGRSTQWELLGKASELMAVPSTTPGSGTAAAAATIADAPTCAAAGAPHVSGGSGAGTGRMQVQGWRMDWAGPRPFLKLADLPMLADMTAARMAAAEEAQAHRAQRWSTTWPAEFDFAGWVVAVGAHAQQGHVVDQWVFLLDDSCLHLASIAGGGAAGQPGQTGGPQGQQPDPWLLAVHIVGSADSVDVLNPHKDVGSLLHLKHLQLQRVDEPNAVWQAIAPDTCHHVKVVPPSVHAATHAGRGGAMSPGVDVHAWVQQNGWVCELACAKAARLGCM